MITRFINQISDFVRRLLRRERASRSHALVDVVRESRRRTLSLRARVLRIEIRFSDIPRVFIEHRDRTVGVAVVLVLLVGLFGYFAPLRATVADLYPASCLGSWENVENALGEPSLGPGAAIDAFTVANSAQFSGGTKQIYCGNFKNPELSFDELRTHAFRSARATISWAAVERAMFAAPAIVPDEIPAFDIPSLSATGTGLPVFLSATTTATSSIPEAQSSTSPASTSGTSALPTEEPSAPEATPSVEMDESPDALPAQPATPPDAPEVPPIDEHPPTSWLEHLVDTVFAQDVSDVPQSASSDPAQGLADISAVMQAPAAPNPSSASDESTTPSSSVALPPASQQTASTTGDVQIGSPATSPSPNETASIVPTSTSGNGFSAANGGKNMSSSKKFKTATSSSTVLSQQTTTTVSNATDTPMVTLEPATTTLVIPSLPTDISSGSSSVSSTLDTPVALQIRMTTDGETWQTLQTIAPGELLPTGVQIPVSSWDEVEHLQLSVWATDATGEARVVLLDGIALEVTYQHAKPREIPKLRKEFEDNQLLSGRKDFSPGERPQFRFRHVSRKNVVTQFFTKVTGFGRYRITKAEVVGSDGVVIDVTNDIAYSSDSDWSLADLGARFAFHPGRYFLRIETSEAGSAQVDTLDFSWGVLAINVDRSVVPLGEEAYLQMAALTDTGHTLCDANLRLLLVDPLGETRELSVERSDACGPDNVTDVPDYFSRYTPTLPGSYRLHLDRLDAQENIIHSIEDMFVVADLTDAPPLDIQRIGPTRIYPPAHYPMQIRVTANADFTGSLVERAPTSFIITEQDIGSIVTHGDVQTKTWNVSMKRGETKTLSYEFKAPDVSPYLYLLGPLKVHGELTQNALASSSAVTDTHIATTTLADALLHPATQTTTTVDYAEPRQWQIAADILADTRGNTVEFFAGQYSGNGTTGQNSNTDQTFSSFSFRLDETNVTVVNAFVVFESQFEAYANNSGDYSGYSLAFDACASPCTPNAWTGSGNVVATDTSVLAYDETESEGIRLLQDVTSEGTLVSYAGGGTVLQGQVGYNLRRAAAVNSIAQAKAKLVLTYSFDSSSGRRTNTVIYPLESNVSGDRGSRAASVSGTCTKNTNCPLFDYLTKIGESTTTNISQWFQTNFFSDLGGTADRVQNVNIQGTDVDSATVRHEASVGGTQGGGMQAYFSGVSGFRMNNASQTLEISDSANTFYVVGGESFYTYTASSSDSTKTKTVRFPIGDVSPGATTAAYTASTTVYFPETGVSVKKAWIRWVASTDSNSNMTLTLSSKVGSNATSSNIAYAMNAGGTVPMGGISIYNAIPTSDYAALQTASATSGVKVAINSQGSSVNLRGVTAELLITFTYTSDSDGYLATDVVMAGQSDTAPNTSWQTPTSSIVVNIPEPSTYVVMLTSFLDTTQLQSSADGSDPAGPTTLGAYLGTTSCSSTNTLTTALDSCNSYGYWYKDVSGVMTNDGTQTYTACYSNDGAGSVSAKANGMLVYTYRAFQPVLAGSLQQAHYHFRNDNGTQASATSATGGIEDTALSNFRPGSSTRLRVEVANVGSGSSSAAFRLEYAAATSGPWFQVGDPTATGTPWIMVDSPNLIDGSSTTNIATSTGGVTDAATTFFVANLGVKDTSSQMATTTLLANNFIEMEFSIKATAVLTASPYYFRITSAGTALPTYSKYPQVNIPQAIQQVHYRWRNDDGNEVTSTFATAEDTQLDNLDKQTVARLRLEAQNYGSDAGSLLYRLEVSGPNPASCATSTYTRVASSSDWQMATSTYVTDGTSTTNISPGLTDANTTFVTGQVKTTGDQASSTTLTGDQFTELEYSLRATSAATDGALYCFRLTNAGATSTMLYSVYARATIIPHKDALVSTFGSQTGKIYFPAVNQYVGGAFVIAATSSVSRSVTSITIAQQGTVNGQTNLSNIKLFYDLDATSPFNCASDTYSGAELQFGSTSSSFSAATGTATFSGSVSIGTTTAMCVYPVLDIGSGTQINDTLALQITSPATDLTLASGTAGPGSVIAIPGTTLLTQPPSLVQRHVRWRNDDGYEVGYTGTGADGTSTISSARNVNTDVIGASRPTSSQADGFATAVTAFGSSTGGYVVTAASGAGFISGDEALLINMQGSSAASGTVGRYEFLRVDSVSSSIITFTSPIQNIYGATSSNANLTGQIVVLQRVPQWLSVTLSSGGSLTASAWDGTTGGILAFRATGNVALGSGSTISVSSLGFRGGTGSNSASGGQNGESYDGYVGFGGAASAGGVSGGGAGALNLTNSQGVRGGGGGGGSNNNGTSNDGGGGAAGGGYGGGGGGAGGSGDGTNGGNGGSGGTTGVGGGGGGGGTGGSGGSAGSPGTGTGGGAAGNGSSTGQGGTSGSGTGTPGGGGGGGGGLYGASTLARIFLGSGGGGGGGDSGGGGNTAVDGSAGGGMAMAFIGSLTNSGGTFTSRGGNSSGPVTGEGAGGGGSGGSIYIIASTTVTTNISATGGASSSGQVGGDNAGGGGAGGVGRIFIASNQISGTAPSPQATTSTMPASTTATWAAPEDASLTRMVIGNAKRIRFMMNNTGGESATSTTYRIEFATATSGPWAAVPTSTGQAWQIATTTYFTDNDRSFNITPGLTDPSSTSTFRVGYLKSAGNQTLGLDLQRGEYSEIEFALRPTANAVAGVTYYFRLTNAGSTSTFTYSAYAQASLNSTPQFSNVLLSSGNDITLTEGTTTIVNALANVTDLDGYADIAYATSSIYRSGVGSSCASDSNNCYQIASSSCFFYGCSGTQCSLSCSIFMQFYAEPTDIGTFSAENWLSSFTVSDQQGARVTTTSVPVELLTLLALDVTSPISYGTLSVNTNTGTTTPTTTVRVTGNAAIDVLLSGTAMTVGPSSIDPSNQKYATSTFNYSTCTICQALSAVSTLLELDLGKPSSTTPLTDDVFWGLFVPIGSWGATHTGQNTFTAILD